MISPPTLRMNVVRLSMMGRRNSLSNEGENDLLKEFFHDCRDSCVRLLVLIGIHGESVE